jgi:hypothetical protein
MQVVLRARDSTRLQVRIEAEGIVVPDFPHEIIIGPFIVPEPSAIALVAIPILGVLANRRQCRR